MNVTFSDIFEAFEELPIYSSTLPEASAAEESIKDQLKESFVDLDNDISEAALDAVKQVGVGYSLTNVTEQHILRAVTGACVNALLSVVWQKCICSEHRRLQECAWQEGGQ